MPTYPVEAYPADATLDALPGTSDSPTGTEYMPVAINKASSIPLPRRYSRWQHRVNLILAVIGQGRVAKETTALKIGVYPIDCIIGGTAISYAGSTNQSVTNAATNYVYLNSSGTLVINTTGYPADITDHFRLARVVCAGGVITSITDDRGFHLFAVPTATSTTDTGTNEASYIIDQDNAGAGADTALKFNRGSTAADAQLEWDEANDRFNLESELAGPTLAILNLLAIYISGTSILTSDGAAKVQSAVAGDGLAHSAGVLSVGTQSSLGTSISGDKVAVDPSDGIALDANGVALNLTASGGLLLTGVAGSKTVGVDVDDSTVALVSGEIAVKDNGVAPVKAANLGTTAGGIEFIFSAQIVAGNTVSIHAANAPFKYRVVDAWSIAQSADGGTWKLDNGTNDLTNAVTVTGTDKTRNAITTLDDAYHEIAASGTLRVVGDGALADCIVYVRAVRVA